MVHALLKPRLKNFDHYFTNVWMVQLCGSLSLLWHCLSLGLEWKLTFSSPVTTAEFSRFAECIMRNAGLEEAQAGIKIEVKWSEVTQSCPTLCDPMNCSLTGSSVHGIFQAVVLEWIAISFSKAWKWKVKVKSFSCVRPSATPWTAAYQAPPSMGFSRQECWSELPFPSPGDLPETAMEYNINWQIDISHLASSSS